MTSVLENSSFLITIGISLLFLLLGTIVGFVIMRKLEKRSSSHFINNKIKPFASASELKSYLYSLEFERRLTAESLTRVFEGMNEGKISSPECDRLILQYKEKLKSFDREISGLRSTSDLDDLQAVRNDLNYFLQNKMKQVDEKLSQILQSNAHVESNSDLLERSINKANRGKSYQIQDRPSLFSRRTKTFINQEKRIQDTQNEIMTTLDRLGGRYTNGNQEGMKTFYSTNKNALAGFDIA